MTDKPNILVIMSDEHDPAVMGCYGDKVVDTPNFDRLADEGITFDAAYTTSPLCVPARLSFVAGQYISRCGAWNNACWLPSDDYSSLPHLLNAAGYDSLLGGKMHFDPERRYGFRDLYESQGNQNKNKKGGGGGRRDPKDTKPVYASWEQRSAKFHAGDTSSVLDKDRDVTQYCSEFLKNYKAEDKPFFLLAGYLSPHFPLIVPQELWDKYKDRVDMPDIPEGFLEKLPTNYKQLRYGFGVTDTDPEVVKKGRELYWAFCEWLDIEVGKLLGALGDSRAADNTIVIYCSDHGENKGDHGLWWKNNMYEHSARMPLIVWYPQRWTGGQRRAQACSLVDLTKTIAELCGEQSPDDWDGASLVPYLDDEQTGSRDLAVCEYFAHNISSGFCMLRQGQWKYVYHTRMNDKFGPERELYDLESDPGEFKNLAEEADQSDRIKKLHALLVKEIGREPDEAETQCRADYARGYERE
ncbi:sulfatase-like hydrolase/transferase [Planctomycetota bacterium]